MHEDFAITANMISQHDQEAINVSGFQQLSEWLNSSENNDSFLEGFPNKKYMMDAWKKAESTDKDLIWNKLLAVISGDTEGWPVAKSKALHFGGY